MNPHFPEIKKNFGFGMMRLPMAGDKVDITGYLYWYSTMNPHVTAIKVN